MTQVPLAADQVGSQFTTMRNVIINGDMRISQRGTSFAAVATNEYTIDKWVYGTTSSAVHTISQGSDPSNQFPYSLKLDCTTADASVAAGDLIHLTQRIEGYNFRRFVGQTATLSFWVKAGKTGTMCVSFRNGTPDRSYVSEVTINAANTWEKKTVTLDFDYSGGTWNYTNNTGLQVGFILMCGSTYQTTAGVWQTGQYYATSNQTNFVDATDATCDVYITGVQLEVGASASDFEFLDYGTQLQQCQRYYYRWTTPGTSRFVGSGPTVSSTKQVYVYHAFPTVMRTNPTLAISDVSHFWLWDSTTANHVAETYSVVTNTKDARVQMTTSTGTWVSGYASIIQSNTASAWLGFDAEL